jgi:tetratricopeptide (TPR) repeat protein
MGLKTLFRPSSERYEQRGDDCVRASDWGMAKVAYDAALDALEKRASNDEESKARILEKLEGSMEALSRQHVQTAEELMESGYDDDARELLELALDLTRDTALQTDIQKRLREVERSTLMADQQDIAETEPISPIDEQEDDEVNDIETFMALCGALPEDVRSAYVSYGPSFQAGYLALNRGDFQFAVDALSRAMEEDPSPDSFISLELATALLNLHRLEEARGLLESFLERHPDALPGYQALCEVFWEMEAFGRAEALLESCPEEVKASWAYVLLRGETLSQAGRHSEAAALYQSFMKEYGRHDALLKALAESYEILGDLVKARDLYSDILNQCQSCRTRVDPLIQRKLADIRFHLGEHNTTVLESYLALAQEDPSNRALYFDRISQIYASMGNEEEARRFSRFARQAEQERKSIHDV